MSDLERKNPSEQPTEDTIGAIDWERYTRNANWHEPEVPAPEQMPVSAWFPDPDPATQVPEEPVYPAAEPEYAPEEPEYAEEDSGVEEGEGYEESYEEGEYEEEYEPEPEYEEPPRKKKKRRKARSLLVSFMVALLYVVSVCAIAFVTATLGWRWANDLLALNKEYHSASITVVAGEDVTDVAEDLKENGLIEYPFLFKVFAGLTNKASRITSGTYELNTNMDFNALLTNMSTSSSARETVTVTIPEGYTVKEIFQLLEQQGACTVEKLEASALNDDFEYTFLDGLKKADDPYWMEGYLYPDTYEFYKDGDAKVVLSKILYNYSKKFDSDMKNRAEWLGYTQEEIMIVASIIEKETDGHDQADIASVIYNRLSTEGETLGKLQMDSTIQYILEERKENLTEDDLSIESPYNTYLNAGLPAGTICNPGMKAIQAALYPNATTYYYFILGGDGKTHFFSDYNDFINFRNGIGVETEDEGE